MRGTIMDENTDNSTKMQVVISLRYINISGSPLEHLLAVLEASSSTGEALSNKLYTRDIGATWIKHRSAGWTSLRMVFKFGRLYYGDFNSESHKGHAFAGTVYVVLVTQFTICHEQHCR